MECLSNTFVSSLIFSQGIGLLTAKCTLQNARNFKLNLTHALSPSLKMTSPRTEQDKPGSTDLSRASPPLSGARKDSLNMFWISCSLRIRYVDTLTVLHKFFMPFLAVLSNCWFETFQTAPSVPTSSHKRLRYATSDQVYRRNHWKSEHCDRARKGRIRRMFDNYFFLWNVDLSVPRTFLVKFQSPSMPGLPKRMIRIWLSPLTTLMPLLISQRTGVWRVN